MVMPFDFRKHADFRSRFTSEAEQRMKEKDRQDRQAALIFALLIGAFAALGIVLVMNSRSQVGPKEMSDCSSIQSESARLACFDELSRHSKSEPFKGSPPTQLGDKK
ncbi:hypothetical protein [Hyphomicrobium sp.]|uniref:hypothetical protein n=1 Tax=Hyphomicrobium sp. TaxID=82 RepID=UPI001E071791|nr:hypothetical protein [Hyphomicrobium sp.]MBY0559201.1 hypothetical protein [Hyphomicrobium sp.]